MYNHTQPPSMHTHKNTGLYTYRNTRHAISSLSHSLSLFLSLSLSFSLSHSVRFGWEQVYIPYPGLCRMCISIFLVLSVCYIQALDIPTYPQSQIMTLLSLVVLCSVCVCVCIYIYIYIYRRDKDTI